MSIRAAYRTSLIALIALAGLSGCASMSEGECLTVDWYERGTQDGRNGRPMSLLQDHREACAKVGVQPDEKRYAAGRTVGLRYYCTLDNGVREGQAGRSYSQVCPVEVENTFLEGYRAGRRVYDAQRTLDNVEQEMQRKERELDKAKDDSARKRLREELRTLDQRVRRAREDVRYAERRLP